MIRRLTLFVLFTGSSLLAQTLPNATVPNLVRFSGTLVDDGQSAHANTVGVTFALYRDQTGGSPLWLETQNVSVDTARHYSVLLGAASNGGIPVELFSHNEARWLGVKPEGQDEQPRVLLVSVPYALKAGDAQTLGGLPPSAFMLNAATPATSAVTPRLAPSDTVLAAGPTPLAGSNVITQNYFPIFADNSGALTNSNATQSATGVVGINTSSPSGLNNAFLHVNGNILLQGQVTHQIQMIGQASAGRLGQDLGGFFFSVDTPGKSMRVLTRPIGGSLTDNRLVITASGNVGIGTASPANLLTAVGPIQSTTGGFVFPDNSVQISAATVTALTAGTGVTVNTTSGNATIAADTTYLNNNYAKLSGSPTFTGTVTAANLATAGALNAGSVTSSGAVGAGSVSTTGTISAIGAAANINVINSNTGTVSGAISSLVSSNANGSAAIVGQESSTNTSSSVVTYGVEGTTSNPFGAGVYGTITTAASSGVGGPGVWGRTVGSGNGVLGESDGTSGFTNGVYGVTFSPGGVGVIGSNLGATAGTAIGVEGSSVSNSTGIGVEGVSASTTAQSGGAGGVFKNTGGGDILVGFGGTNGTSRTFRVGNDGTVYGAAFNTTGADFAESFVVTGAKATYQPGDVLMIDETGTRRLALSDEPYSTKVAGVYATKPGVLASPYGIDDPRRADGVPLAVVGVVPCKVSTENGSIHAGDLLVTASRAGYAMKGTDRQRMLGAIVGKALGSLENGTGVIEVLVSLH